MRKFYIVILLFCDLFASAQVKDSTYHISIEDNQLKSLHFEDLHIGFKANGLVATAEHCKLEVQPHFLRYTSPSGDSVLLHYEGSELTLRFDNVLFSFDAHQLDSNPNTSYFSYYRPAHLLDSLDIMALSNGILIDIYDDDMTNWVSIDMEIVNEVFVLHDVLASSEFHNFESSYSQDSSILFLEAYEIEGDCFQFVELRTFGDRASLHYTQEEDPGSENSLLLMELVQDLQVESINERISQCLNYPFSCGLRHICEPYPIVLHLK
jgi:hypothetical protein